jgi:hypothetical protein
MALASEDLPLQNQGDPTQTMDFPIAIKTTNNSQEQDKPARPNKYIYPEFAGYSGEDYLNTLLQQILPYALYRTWHFAVAFQAPGNVCYVGTARLAERVKPGVRKIEIDLQELEGRGLMRRYTDRIAILQEDGTFIHRAVSIKDFSPLYTFAYEYHLWLNSPEYVPAERDYEDFFIKDPQLCARLMKYDNYRRLFTCQKPGPKPKENPLHVVYQCQLPPDQGPDTQEKASTPVPNSNLYLQKQFDTPSPYRRTKNEEKVSLSNSSSSDLEEKEPVAIGNVSSELNNIAVDTIRNEENISSPLSIETESKQTESQTEEENRAVIAGNAKEYTVEDLKKNPLAMAAFLLDLQPQIPTSTEKPKHEKRQKRGTPAQLARSLSYMVQQLGENPKSLQSDITRVTKIYWAATQLFTGFKNSWFLDRLQEAFVAACKARGVKRRVPYFFVCLENILQLTPEEKAFIRSDEPLYTDGKDIKSFIFQLRRTYEKSGSELDYHGWIQQNYLSKPLS